MEAFRDLPTQHCQNIDTLTFPTEPQQLTLHSPALSVLTDFSRTKPLIIEASTPIDRALEMMKKSHVRMKLVVDEQEHFLGIISTIQLQSDDVLAKATKLRLPRNELSVKDVMLPRQQLQVLELKTLSKAKVGDLLQTLKHLGLQHTVVVDAASQQICGMISAADIARKLHIPFELAQRNVTFAAIFNSLYPAQ